MRGERGDGRGDQGVAHDGVRGGVKKALPATSLQRNKFWALAESDADESDDDDGGAPAEITSPTPSDLVCESLRSRRSEEEVAGSIAMIVSPCDLSWDGLSHGEGAKVLRRVVHRRTAPSAIRPWKGSLPKLSLPSLTLADFLGNWRCMDNNKKNGRCRARQSPPPAISPAKMITTATKARLNSLLGLDGPEKSVPQILVAGYSAQLQELEDEADSCQVHRSAAIREPPVIRVTTGRLRPRIAKPGFPVFSGRVTRVVPAPSPSPSDCMAGMGSGGPPPRRQEQIAAKPEARWRWARKSWG
ncbi:hypothetical protein D1007_61250 [Hordeum vulgare]|nr:hypothetical protein D1007_61250 [Hordeum vulgare]